MEKGELFEKNKNKFFNLGVIVLALFIAFQIYKSFDQQLNLLVGQKVDELNKNAATQEIASLERKIAGYKKVFIKKDVGAVMDTISNIAKSSSVKVISIKPNNEEAFFDYVKSVFVITISVPGYHYLGDFVSQIESYKDIYMVDEVSIVPAENNQLLKNVNKNLNVTLRISTIAYL